MYAVLSTDEELSADEVLSTNEVVTVAILYPVQIMHRCSMMHEYKDGLGCKVVQPDCSQEKWPAKAFLLAAKQEQSAL